MKGTGVVTASWYNLRVEETLGPTSQPNHAQHAIGHCLPPCIPLSPRGITIAIVLGHHILKPPIKAPKILHE
jgi:hypothetical protein